MNFLDYAIIVVYLVGLLFMGFLLKNQNDKQDYFLGGRTLGWKPLSLSIMATQLSAISFVSAPAFVGLREGGGLIWLSYELAVPIAMLLLLWKVLPRLYNAGVVSVYDYLEGRFNRSTRLLLSFVFQMSRSFATAIMIYAVSIILQGTIGLAYWQSILLIGCVTVVYSLQGGMKAVVYGDALQMVLIVLGTAACLGFALYHIGGVQIFLDGVDPDRLQAVNFSSFGINGEGFGFWPMLFGGVVLYASYYGCDQSEAQRLLSAKNQHDLKKMVMVATFMRFPVTLLYCMSGLVIGTLVLTTPSLLAQIPANKPDWMMPIFIVNYMPNGVIGLLLVAILAAAMSSLSSAVNSLSAVSVEDYCRLKDAKLSNEQYLVAARYMGIFWGIVTLGLSFFAGNIAPTVIEAINKIGSLFYGPILAIFTLGLLIKRVNGTHASIGLVSGVFINVCVWQFAPNIFWFWWNLIGFLSTAGVGILTSFTFNIEAAKQDSGDTKALRSLSLRDASLMILWFIFIVAIAVTIPFVL